MWHPMRQGYWHFLIQVSENIRQRIDIWEITTTTKEGGLEILARRILKSVIPGIERMYEQSKLVKRLRMEDKNSTQAPVQVQPPTPPAPTPGCLYGRPRGSGKGGRRGRPRKGGA